MKVDLPDELLRLIEEWRIVDETPEEFIVEACKQRARRDYDRIVAALDSGRDLPLSPDGAA